MQVTDILSCYTCAKWNLVGLVGYTCMYGYTNLEHFEQVCRFHHVDITELIYMPVKKSCVEESC